MLTEAGAWATRCPWAGELEVTAAWAPAGPAQSSSNPRLRAAAGRPRRRRPATLGRRPPPTITESLLTGAETYGVDQIGVARAVDVQVVMGEHPLWALPSRHHPCVHHPHRLRHEDAVDIGALLGCDALVRRERHSDLACFVLHADVGVTVPVVVRPDESRRRLGGQRFVHYSHDWCVVSSAGVDP